MNYKIIIDGKMETGVFFSVDDCWKWLELKKGITQKKRKGHIIKIERITEEVKREETVEKKTQIRDITKKKEWRF